MNGARARRRKWLLLLVALTVSMLLAEVVARFALARLNATPPRRPSGGEEVLLVAMLQKARHDDIVYELQPGLDCRFQGVSVRTNSAGQRGPERALVKPDGGFRVLALGDSVIFGWGVEWPETCLPRLEERLRAALPGRAVDVVGTGVPGYNTTMEAAVLREVGLTYAPDVVLVDFVDNDLDLPNFLLAPADFFALDHCYLVDLARRAWRSDWLDPHSPFVWTPREGDHYLSSPERVPPQHRHMVGPDGFRRALQAIMGLCERHGCHLLMTCHTRLRPEAEAVRAELGVPVVVLQPRIQAWLKEHGNPPYQGSALTVRADDPHPSAMVHDWWAEAVFERLRELGWLKG